MTPARTLAANHAQKAAHRAKVEEAQKLAAEIAAEQRARADEEGRAVRAHIRTVTATQPPDEVIAVDNGPTRLLARDGLAWLVAKGKLNAAQRMAGERYRVDFEALHGGSLRSCLNDTPGGRFASTEILPPLQFATAREALDRARRHGLASDNTLIWLCDEVAGKGATLRDIAAGDKHRAAALEIELSVALRLLARHYGFAS